MMIAKTDAPYSVLKKFWDPYEVITFGSPKAIEGKFVDKNQGNQPEDITDHYLESFVDSLREIRSYFFNLHDKILRKDTRGWTDEKLEKYGFVEKIIWSEVTETRISFDPVNRRISLDWIMIRPCAEGNKLYAITMYWMAKICAIYKDIDFQIHDCLEVNRGILRKYEFHEQKYFYKEWERDIYDFIYTNTQCKKLKLETWKLEDKIRECDVMNNIMILRQEKFRSPKEMNDWEYVQKMFYDNDHLVEDYMKHMFAAEHNLEIGSRQFNIKYAEEEFDFKKKIQKAMRLRLSRERYEHYKRRPQQKLAKLNASRSISSSPTANIDLTDTSPHEKEDKETDEQDIVEDQDEIEEDDEITNIILASGQRLQSRIYLVEWKISKDQTWEKRDFFDLNEHRKELRENYDLKIKKGNTKLVNRRSIPTALPGDDDDQQYQEIEKILAAYGNQTRGNPNNRHQRRYLVKWKNDDVTTWEPKEIFNRSEHLQKMREDYDRLLSTRQRRLIGINEITPLRPRGVGSLPGIDYEFNSLPRKTIEHSDEIQNDDVHASTSIEHKPEKNKSSYWLNPMSFIDFITGRHSMSGNSARQSPESVTVISSPSSNESPTPLDDPIIIFREEGRRKNPPRFIYDGIETQKKGFKSIQDSSYLPSSEHRRVRQKIIPNEFPNVQGTMPVKSVDALQSAKQSVSDIKKVMESTSKLSGSSDDDTSDAWSSDRPLYESDASGHDSPMPRPEKKTDPPPKRPLRRPRKNPV
jgi:hypothetical protein